MLFLTLVRLKTGMTAASAAFLFGVSESVVCRTFESGLLHMYHCFRVLFKPPTLAMMARTCPPKVRARFKAQVGYIIDCSDLECQTGSDPQVTPHLLRQVFSFLLLTRTSLYTEFFFEQYSYDGL